MATFDAVVYADADAVPHLFAQQMMVVFVSGHGASIPPLSSQSSAPQYSYGGHHGTSKKIEIPNGRVGVIIGKAGETIRYIQLQPGEKIQVMRGHEVEPGALTRQVELSGNPEQISKAEQLIKEVIVEVLLIMFLDFCLLLCVFIYITIFDLAIYADVGSFGVVSGGRKYNAPQPGAETFQMKIANNKVGLIIGKGGETIKSMQANQELAFRSGLVHKEGIQLVE
ncbi:Far upstream element-binding protein 1 [Zea mays]|uniref:Far upstream element-binding protein 1 n=1 Tax=Zea mays TaxID=4577 RepID=A0A3L6FGL6_MAIZE|nr:Far upstream element-binding protein 1 [Zea mays]